VAVAGGDFAKKPRGLQIERSSVGHGNAVEKCGQANLVRHVKVESDKQLRRIGIDRDSTGSLSA